MKYRKMPVVVEATQWWKNGDHPDDHLPPADKIVAGERTEGSVVRYYRHPPVDPSTGEISAADDAILLGRLRHCDAPDRFRRESCEYLMDDHGWIDNLEGGHTVCPGDFIITGVQGEHYSCKPDIFTATYEPVSRDARPFDPALADRQQTALTEWLDEHRPGWRAIEQESPFSVADPDLLSRMLREYGRSTARLIGLPHPSVIPSSWRSDRVAPLSLTEAVDLVCEHVPGNTLGAPDGYVPPQPRPLSAAATAALLDEAGRMSESEEHSS